MTTDSFAQLSVDEVVDLDLLGFTGGAPFSAAVLVLADKFLFLRVDGDHRITGVQVIGGLVVEVGELGIAVRMIGAFKGFRVRLQG